MEGWGPPASLGHTCVPVEQSHAALTLGTFWGKADHHSLSAGTSTHGKPLKQQRMKMLCLGQARKRGCSDIMVNATLVITIPTRKRIFQKTRIGLSSILQCSEYIHSYLWYCTDLWKLGNSVKKVYVNIKGLFNILYTISFKKKVTEQ